MDVNQLKNGKKYKELKPRYVIFICAFDKFEKGLCKYTFLSQCQEVEGLILDNGIIDIVINTKGDTTGYPEEFQELMAYIAGKKKASDCKYSLIQKIDKEVELANRDAKWRSMHMTLAERYEELEDHYLEQGREEGTARGIELGEENERRKNIISTAKLLQKKGATDEEMINDLMVIYELSDEDIKDILNS